MNPQIPNKTHNMKKGKFSIFWYLCLSLNQNFKMKFDILGILCMMPVVDNYWVKQPVEVIFLISLGFSRDHDGNVVGGGGAGGGGAGSWEINF